MRINFLLFVLSCLLLVSCNKDEGIGGSSSLEGYVYQIEHSADNFSFRIDTFPAVDVRTFLIFGNNDDDFYGKDTRTDKNGLYRFDYLREGNYITYSLSEPADNHAEAVSTTVKVKGSLTKADTIFIHTGKAYGTSMIKGSVWAEFWDKTSIIDRGHAINSDVFINHYGEEMFFERIRVSENGTFIFQKILPGKYKVWVTSEDPITRKLTPIEQIIEVTETEKVYELPEKFTVKVRA
ncbi:hypothetical protein FACS1894160_3450 [Bacteroidia bacterium]|nr:hypothetical protein FACS1894160_3450 [Bacteroidia bacterium]